MRDRKRWAILALIGVALAIGVLASACTAGADSSEPQPGNLANCPQAGKWAVSVWGGEDSAAVVHALGSCGEQAVAAAYYIDADTQAWSRWFGGRPEISNLVTLENGQGLITLGSRAAAGPTEGDGFEGIAGDGMVGCPQPGKWAIAVWTGVDGTATDEAVGHCTGLSVAAAYWIDPQTQQWQRYFEGRPEISNLSSLDRMQGIIALGSEAGPAPTPTERPLPLPTETPASTPTMSPSSPTPTATPAGGLQLTLIAPASVGAGDTDQVSVRLEGDPTPFAAFNFDVVYDQTVISLGAPEPVIDDLNTEDRTFQCDLPPPSGDVDPDPQIGRARLVCFSFGGPEASAPSPPLTIATIELTAVQAGSAELTFDNVALFKPDATGIAVVFESTTILVE